MISPTELVAEVNVAVAFAGAAYAEASWITGMSELFVPGMPEPIAPAEIHKRAVDLYQRAKDHAPSVRANPERPGPTGRLRRTHGGIEANARFQVEFAEVLTWCAGVRSTPPPGDVPTQAASSATLWTLWSGGANDQTIRPVTQAKLTRARRACAAWGWRLRVEWLRAYRHVIHKDLARKAKYVIARRAEFARKLRPLRLVKIEHEEFLLTPGWPLSHNYFAYFEIQTENLFRPRYVAYCLVDNGTPERETLADWWTEAVGKPPGGDAAKWPQS